MTNINQYDFVISGGGLVGCTTALELSKKGFKCCLIEKNNIRETIKTNEFHPLSLNYRSIVLLKKFGICSPPSPPPQSTPNSPPC